MIKFISCVLSFTLIFTSVTPSLAQVRASSPFRVSGHNALDKAVQAQVATTLDRAEDAWWVAQGEKLVAQQCAVRGLPCMLEVLFKAQQAAPKQDILQAVVCDKDSVNCVPALAYAWGGVHYATQHLLYYQDKPILETAPQFVELVGEYGLHSEPDRQVAMRYFYALIDLAKQDCSNGALEVGSQQNRADTRRANELQAGRCTAELAAMPALAMISKTQPEKKKAAETVYDVLESKYDEASGGAVITAGVTALGVLGTPRAYALLEKFITQDTIPSTLGNMWEGVWSAGKSTAQNSLRAASNIRGGNSRYLNRINEQFQYLDKAEAKRQGFTNTAWQSEGRQYPYANVLEEVGAFIGQQSASNASAQKLAKKLVAQANEAAKSKTNAAGTLHYPVVLGILDGWRTHGKKFIYEPDPALLSLFYKGDWFDINEGTQRRIHQKAYQFAKLRGYTAWKAPVFDKEKKQRYIYNARIMGMGQASDVVVPLLLVEGLFRIVPALAKGIPMAVRTLRGRTALVGTKNYLKGAKSVKPVAKEIALKTANTVAKETPKPAITKPTKPAKFSVEKLDNRTAQIVPEGYSVEQLNPGRTHIAPKTYASQGAPVANTAKVQPVTTVTSPANSTSAVRATSAQDTPYIRGKVINSFGQEVEAWVKNPNYKVPVATNQIRKLGWLDKAKLQWGINLKPAFRNLLGFGTSRYGLAALGPGAAPVSSEAAIARAGNSVEIVQNIRAQQGMFIVEDALRGGSGASYRVGAVNPGGVAAQQFTKQMLGTTARTPSLSGFGYLTPKTLSAVRPWLKAGALIPAGVMGASLLFGSDTGLVDGLQTSLAMSPMFVVPNFAANWILSKTHAADKHANNILNQVSPLATQLVSILNSPASLELKQKALVRLYKMGKLTKILQSTLPPAAMQAVVDLGRVEDTTALGQRLYSLYDERLIFENVNNITDTAAQGELLKELADVVSAPGFINQSRALWEAADQIPVMSVEDIGTTSFVPEADLEKVYSSFRTDPDFVATHVTAQDEGSLLHYDNHIPFYYRDSHGNLSEEPVGILTQNQPGWYSRLLSHIPLYWRLPKWNHPSTWFNRDFWKLNYMSDKAGIDIPKGFVLALDENGQWKFLKNDRALAESNPSSKKLLREIEAKGSVQVGLETPYSTADLLAIAKMLEKKTQAQRVGKLTSPLSFELALNSADSFKQMLKVWGFYVGLDTGASLSGPFKDAARGLEGAPVNAVSNAVGGTGYASPIVAAFSSKWMRSWGLKSSMFGLFALAGLGLGYSLLGLGMTGFDDPKALGLDLQTIPFITAIFTGSLFGVLQPLVLNHYKNPVARTAANLEFSSTKQKARMLLTFATFAFGLKSLGGLEWTMAIPAAFGLLGLSFLLFLNTPLVRSATPTQFTAADNPTVNNLLSSVKKQEKKKISREQKKAETKEFARDYKQTFAKSEAVKGIRDRVANVYAGYAPLMALISQIVNDKGTLPLISGEKIGQLVMVAFMFSAYRMRKWATNAVKSNRYTDDQLTGLSLPILAATSAAIMFMPFNSIYALATAVVVAGLYVGTAVPGQLDNTRMQNIVSEEMQSRKQAVQNDASLSNTEKEEKLAKLDRQEKDWAFRATRDYSYYNGVGLVGVAAATAVAYFLGDELMASSFLQSIQMYDESLIFTMDRLIFGLSAVVLGALAWRHRNLTTDFMRARHPIQISEENIQAGNVNASAFGISQRNVGANLGKLNKTLKDLQKLSIEHGLSSEKKMTDMLNKMVGVYNRLLAIKEVKGAMDVGLQGSFNTLLNLAKNYKTALAYNNLSVMLNREFDKFRLALSKDGQLRELSEDMHYLEEGFYKLPSEHAKFTEAKDLIQKDLFQLAHRILNGTDVDARTYRLFIEYQNRAMEDLQKYIAQNVADSKRALDLKRELNGICLTLKKADDMSGILEINAGPTSPKDIQALRDMLAGFPYEGENFH